ncbi:unnamed protein product, partial [marine sediment metagenome]
MTGRYPHRNGAMGFEPINESVPTLQEALAAAGYMNGIFAKEEHLQPESKFCWDTLVKGRDLAVGRDPALFYGHARDFFLKARDGGRPFFLMANSQDPHRPFAGSEREPGYFQKRGMAVPKASRHYRSDEIEVPGFLPDLPDVRRDIARYYTSAHRCDETAGAVLRALRESGLEENTLVMFLSDNGIAVPFAKANCYLTSTRTPWIVRWPGKIRPGSTDDTHFISGIDFMPTILEAAGLPAVEGMDGRSFLALLKGGTQEGRESVFTAFHEMHSKKQYPMRCVQNRRHGYKGEFRP